MDVRIAIAGVGGKMCRTLIEQIAVSEGLALVGGIEQRGSFLIGRKLSELSQSSKVSGAISDSIEGLPEFDVLIDFSTPDASLERLSECVEINKSVVVGTTGFGEDQMLRVQSAAQKIAVVHAHNYSVGLTLLLDLVERASTSFGGEADVEIIEMHHNQKVDAPSGTAYALLESVKAGQAQPQVVHGRQGLVGQRQEGEIGLHAVRGGDVVGEHHVIFAMAGERIELTHRAHSRLNFAEGALRACRWVCQQSSPGLFDMRDVLGMRDQASSVSQGK